jgi:hypothetical protein
VRRVPALVAGVAALSATGLGGYVLALHFARTPASVGVRILDAGPAVEVGPDEGPPDDTTASDRTRRDLDMLEGKADASALPVVATDPSAAFDPALRERLAPTIYRHIPGPLSSSGPAPPGPTTDFGY